MENPFVFDRPNNINVDDFLKFYIKDHTYTRFLESTRNILLIGVRGSGKTSTLMYYSYPLQLHNNEVVDKQTIVGIHIPCKNPIFGKKEYLLFSKENKKYIIVEHFLCINIISCICDTFLQTLDSLDLEKKVEDQVLSNLSFILDTDLSQGDNLFERLKFYISKESIASQKRLNSDNFESFIDYSFSFNNTVVTIFEQLKKIPKLSTSHFSLFFDDIQDLSHIHKEVINSWIAYRDNKLFSFKIASADIKPFYLTATGGVILEGHDFIKIDLTKRVFSKDSEFGNFAKDVINKRLELAGINKNADEFFPINLSFKERLGLGREQAKLLAFARFPNSTGTQISDYVAKYGRAIAFRRKAKENLLPYSGIDSIIDISTGVVRNLLTPIFYMYEKEVSNNNNGGKKVDFIPAKTQSEIIIKSSEEFWNKLKSIDAEIEDCPSDLAQYINNFFDQLMIYLKKRLNDGENSEPRALNFIISRSDSDLDNKIKPIIEICLKSTLLYRRTISHKANGRKLMLYIPNRLMLPAHGLDPHGQYSHFPITSKAFYEAAYLNKPIPYSNKDDESLADQLELELL